MASYRQLTSRKAVLLAITHCDSLTAEGARAKYGFDAARTYRLQFEGRAYDSKLIVAVAFGLQWPEHGPLTSDTFSGGKDHAARHLARLGFAVEGIVTDPTDWSLAEVDAVVGIYFQMAKAFADGTYVRGEWLGRAETQIPTRGRGAIERKISNICAILSELQLPYLRGFGAQGNKQTLLTAVIIDRLQEMPDTFDEVPAVPRPSLSPWPEVSPPSKDNVRRAREERSACKIDFAARDEHNRRLGRAGEVWALAMLQNRLCDLGRPDLAERTVWVSDRIGDGLGYDIQTFSLDGSTLYVEVKTTNLGINSPFVVTRNELSASKDMRGYITMRIFNFMTHPEFYILNGCLADLCELRPATYHVMPTGMSLADSTVTAPRMGSWLT